MSTVNEYVFTHVGEMRGLEVESALALGMTSGAWEISGLSEKLLPVL